MIKLKQIESDELELYPLPLDDLSLAEKKIAKKRCLREIKLDIDKDKISVAMDILGLDGQKMSSKRVGKVIDKIISTMIEEA